MRDLIGEPTTISKVTIKRKGFLEDGQGKTFADVVNDPSQSFDEVLRFFNDAHRQRRMEGSELYHDRTPLAGVLRELRRTMVSSNRWTESSS